MGSPKKFKSYETALSEAQRLTSKGPQYRDWTDEARDREAVRLAATWWADLQTPATTTDPETDEWSTLAQTTMDRYLEHFAFDTPAAVGQLQAIVRIEVEMAKLDRKLADPKLTEKARDGSLDSLRKMADTHRALVVAAGIDRRSGEERKDSLSPMEQWETQMVRSHLYRAWREFGARDAIRNANRVEDIVAACAYHLGHNYETVWIPLAAAFSRVLGVPLQPTPGREQDAVTDAMTAAIERGAEKP